MTVESDRRIDRRTDGRTDISTANAVPRLTLLAAEKTVVPACCSPAVMTNQKENDSRSNTMNVACVLRRRVAYDYGAYIQGGPKKWTIFKSA